MSCLGTRYPVWWTDCHHTAFTGYWTAWSGLCYVVDGHLCWYTGLFISHSGISELDCATTKTDTAERSISIGRESLQVFFVLGALANFQIPPLGGSREEKLRSQWIRKRSVSWNLPKLSQLWLCNGGFGSCTTQNHLQTKQFVNGTWITVDWLPVRCETNRPSGPMGPWASRKPLWLKQNFLRTPIKVALFECRNEMKLF